jgi:DNA (cytosine-5)-methyltransferase 3A
VSEPKFDLNVTLSLFDGISCGQEALKKAGISTRIFLASEIEKYPKMITRKNHPLTVQLGDVTKVVADDLPHVNLLMGGSPCQGFSFAGKQLNFDDPRSALFFEFVRLLKECKPDYFLLENVMMKQEYQDIITEHLGVEPVMINSALVSAQNRKRLYWTNIPGVSQPEDKGILLKDVLEESPEDYTLMSDRFVNRNKDAGCLVDSDKPKASSLSAMEYVKNGRQGDYILCGRIVGRRINPETGKRDDYNLDLKAEQRLEPRLDEKSGTLTTVQKDNVLIVPEATKKGYTEIEDGDCFDATFINSKTRRGRNMKDKSNCLTAANFDYMRYEHPTYRKLTPIECERLQTLPDNYTEGVSNTQRYKALGNGWTVDVIVHILQGLKQQVKAVAA